MVEKLENGKLYKWIGSKERPKGFNNDGYMDEILDGVSRKFISNEKDSGYFEGCINPETRGYNSWGWSPFLKDFVEIIRVHIYGISPSYLVPDEYKKNNYVFQENIYKEVNTMAIETKTKSLFCIDVIDTKNDKILVDNKKIIAENETEAKCTVIDELIRANKDLKSSDLKHKIETIITYEKKDE